MARKESSDEMSKLAGRIMKLSNANEEAGIQVGDFNDLLADAKALAASVLSQDETPKKKVS